MSCERPIRIRNPRYNHYFGETELEDGTPVALTDEDICEAFFGYRGPLPDKYLDVPCGKCHSCRKHRLNGYRVRLLAELNRFPQSVFVTLTFSDHYLDKFKDDPNRSVRLFMDRARKKYGKSLRHFFIAEFGDENDRLHYHGIIFNTPKFNPKEFSKLWKYGFCWLGWCNAKTVNYIVKYITKGSLSREKIPRILSSQGLGISYVEQRSKFHRMTQTAYITKGHYRVPLPRYYLKKIFSTRELLLMTADYARQPFVRFVDGRKYDNYFDYKIALMEYARKQEMIRLTAHIAPLKDSMRSLDYFTCPDTLYITPWDEFNYSKDDFNVFVSTYDTYLVPMGDNQFVRSLTPF